MKVLALRKEIHLHLKIQWSGRSNVYGQNEYDVLVGANHIKYKLNNGPLTNGQENWNHTEKKTVCACVHVCQFCNMKWIYFCECVCGMFYVSHFTIQTELYATTQLNSTIQ